MGHGLDILGKAKGSGDWFVNEKGKLVARFEKTLSASLIDEALMAAYSDESFRLSDGMTMRHEVLKDVHNYLYNHLISIRSELGHIEFDHACGSEADIDLYVSLSAKCKRFERACAIAEDTLLKLKEGIVTLEA